jgi:hypothetical protein
VSKTGLKFASMIVAVAACIGIAWAAGDWNTAQSKVEEMKRKTMELRKLTPEEIRGVVAAVCDADEDERRDVGERAAARVAEKVKGELSNLERVRDDADRLINDVLSDDNLKPNHDDARKLRDEVAQRWKSVENMAKNAMRGGNHPLISYMSLKGIEEHKNYQRNSSNCDASEIETGSRRADCLRAEGDTCYVIELKPNNSRAISKGNTQADDAVRDLDAELAKMAKGEGSEVMRRLIGIKSDFANCKRWKKKLMCYSLCPAIDEEGEYREGSVAWSSC